MMRVVDVEIPSPPTGGLDVAEIDALSARQVLSREALASEASRLFDEAGPQVLIALRAHALQDARWIRALSREAHTRGVAGQQARARATQLLASEAPLQISQLLRRDSELLVWLRAPYAAIDPGRLCLLVEDEPFAERVVQLPRGAHVSLVEGLEGEPPERVLALHHEGACTLEWLDETLTPIESITTSVKQPPQRITRFGDSWLTLSDRVFQTLSDGVEYERCEASLWAGSGRCVRVGDHILTESSSANVQEAHRTGFAATDALWFDLKQGQVTRIPWSGVRSWALSDEGELFVTTHRGLERCAPGQVPELVWEQPHLHALSAGQGRFHIARTDERCVITLDQELRELARVEVQIDALHALPRRLSHGAVFGSSQWQWVLSDGQLGASARGNTGCAALRRERFSAAHTQRSLLVVREDGSHFTFDLERDAILCGATDTHVILCARAETHADTGRLIAVEVTSGEVSTIEVEGCREPVRTYYGGGSVSDRGAVDRAGVDFVVGQTLRRWCPAPSAALPAIPCPAAPRREAEVWNPGFETSNPRDDWPVPGLDVAGQDYEGHRCTFGGTWGVASAPAVQARSGADVVLVDCTLRAGGAQVRDGSTLWLVRCALGEGPFSADESSHIIAIDCDRALPESSSRVTSHSTKGGL